MPINVLLFQSIILSKISSTTLEPYFMKTGWDADCQRNKSTNRIQRVQDSWKTFSNNSDFSFHIQETMLYICHWILHIHYHNADIQCFSINKVIFTVLYILEVIVGSYSDQLNARHQVNWIMETGWMTHNVGIV